MTIQVLYTCLPCGIIDAKVEVPARTTEDVITWVEKIMGPAIAEDHRKRSPNCCPATLSNVKIPVTGATRIGGPTEN